MPMVMTNANTDTYTRRVTLTTDPYTNTNTNLPWCLGQDNRGYQYQIALDAIPPGFDISQVKQNQIWFVNNAGAAYRLWMYAGTVSGAITPSGGGIYTNSGTGSGGPGYYGSYYSNETQTIASTTTAYPIVLEGLDSQNGVTVSGTPKTRITVANSGEYSFFWSGQFQNTAVKDEDVQVWVRKNGTDIPGSTGLVSIPSTHGGVHGHSVAGWNFFFSLNANDYIELYWQSSSTAVTLQYYAGGTAPTTPTTSSVVATIAQVAYNIVGSGGGGISQLTGDVTASGSGSVVATLSNTGVTPGPYGSSSQIPVLTVDSKGRITSATTATVSGGSGVSGITQLTGDVTTASGSGAQAATLVGTAAVSGVVNTIIGANTTVTGKVNNTTVVTGTTGQITGGGTLASNQTFGLATVGTSGLYGTSTSFPIITTDSYGRVTNVSVQTVNSGGFTNALFTSPIETVVVTGTQIASGGTINLVLASGSHYIYNNASGPLGNFTINIDTRNSNLANNQSVTVVANILNGTTAYRPTSITVQTSGGTTTLGTSGTNTNVWWQGTGLTWPTLADASHYDAYTITLVQTGSSAWTAFAAQTKF